MTSRTSFDSTRRPFHLPSIFTCAAFACLAACGGGDPEPAPPDLARKQAAAASAKGTVVYRTVTKGKSAYANYFEFTNDCEQLALEVFANEDRANADGTQTASSSVRAQLSSYNACTGDIGFMSGATDTAAIKLRNDLTHGKAVAAVVMADEFGTMRTVAVDLDWDGGVLTVDKQVFKTVTPTSITIIKSSGSVRQSETVSGALVLDGVDLLAPDRPVGNRGISGFMTASKGMTIEVTRTH